MSQAGRKNTIKGITGLLRAMNDIRNDIVRARADGEIDKEEAIKLLGLLVSSIIKEGMVIATSVTESKI